jgi:hypothetical protein
MDSYHLQEYHQTLDNILARHVTSDEIRLAMFQAQIAIAHVEQLEKLNANLEQIELTLRHNMEVAVIQP